MKRLFHYFKNHPSVIFYCVLVFVVGSLILTILIDMFNIFGIKEYMIRVLDVPFFWYHWFPLPFELPLQWYMLGLVMLVFAFIAGKAYQESDQRAFNLWLFLSIGLMLMIVEDAGDVRHHIRFRLEEFTGEGNYGMVGTLWELFYFGVIGIFMIFPVIYYRDVYWHKKSTRKYLFIGYLLYGISQVSSFASTAFQSAGRETLAYDNIGEYIMTRFFVRDEITSIAYEMAVTTDEWFNFDFMDVVYEEAVEFIGAGALITAGLFFLSLYNKRPKPSSNGKSGYHDLRQDLFICTTDGLYQGVKSTFAGKYKQHHYHGIRKQQR